MESNLQQERSGNSSLDGGDVATSEAGASLWHAFDRIRDGLLKQEQMRKRPAPEFDEWVRQATPAFTKYVGTVTAECEAHYGLAYCHWLDWLDARKLAWRGEIKWQIPTKGPLRFEPPSAEGLTERIRQILGELDLVENVRHSARLSAAPTQKTRGARGRKMERSLTVWK